MRERRGVVVWFVLEALCSLICFVVRVKYLPLLPLLLSCGHISSFYRVLGSRVVACK